MSLCVAALLSWSSVPASKSSNQGRRERQSISGGESDQQAGRTQGDPPHPHKAASHPFALLSRPLPRAHPPPLAQASASGFSLPQPEGAVFYSDSEPTAAAGSASWTRSFPPVQHTERSAAPSPSPRTPSLGGLFLHPQPLTLGTFSWIQSDRHSPLPSWIPAPDADSPPQRTLSELGCPAATPASAPPPDVRPHSTACQHAAPSHTATPAHADHCPASSSATTRTEPPTTATSRRQHPVVPHPPTAASPASPCPLDKHPDSAPPLSELGGFSACVVAPRCRCQPVSAPLHLPPTSSADWTASTSPPTPPTDSTGPGPSRFLPDALWDPRGPCVLDPLPQLRVPEHRVALTAPSQQPLRTEGGWGWGGVYISCRYVFYVPEHTASGKTVGLDTLNHKTRTNIFREKDSDRSSKQTVR